MPSPPDLIVVGAGIAGLPAAKQAVQQGLIVVVLEARECAGGRIREHHIHHERGIAVVEAGAEFIHGADSHLLSLLADAGIEAFTVPELLAMVGAEEAGLLKLDIEGAELGLLEHPESWKPQVRAMVVELHEYKQAGIDAAFEAVAADALSRRRVGENHYVRFR